MSHSYYEKIARINLTSGQITIEQTDVELASRFIGGRGLGGKLLLGENSALADPLSPENPLIMVTGPMTCGLGPSAGRYSIVTRSPITGKICASNSSGHWGALLKYAGWDALIIEGKAPALSYLVIENDQISLKEGPLLVQKMTDKTDTILKSMYGESASVLTIGPAGENLASNAAIINDQERAAGRNAIGAVMGSKNLKAIVLTAARTDITPLIHDTATLQQMRNDFSKRFPTDTPVSSSACSKCLIPCGRASNKKKEDPELTECNRTGIDATKKDKKKKYYEHMTPDELYLNAVIDSMGLCMFAKKYLDADQICSWINAVIGSQHTTETLLQCGREICAQEEETTLRSII